MPDAESLIRRIDQAAEAELAGGLLTGVSLAAIDGGRIVHAAGYGLADKVRRVPAAANTVYRAGSISKLFNAVAAMQLVERGLFDLDRPVTEYAPEVRIGDSSGAPAGVTARQFLCHRAGFVREAPVGNYFDATQPSLARTVTSGRPWVLICPPNTKTKYSNVGASVVGYLVEKIAGRPFDAILRDGILGPLGMTRSAFSLSDRVRETLATGYMRAADGSGGLVEIEAPLFELGTIPAGNLYSTAEDLGRFVLFVLAGGQAGGPTGGQAGERRVVQPATLAQMLRPQLIDGEEGFGLGFYAGTYHGRRAVGHNGAVYGFSAMLTVLPEAGLGVVVLANEDLTLGPLRRLHDAILEAMLEAKDGRAPSVTPPSSLHDADRMAAPQSPQSAPTASDLTAYVGTYESDGLWARVEAGDGRLVANISGQAMTLTPAGSEPAGGEQGVGGDRWVGNGRLYCNTPVTFDRDEAGRVCGLGFPGQTFRRIDPSAVRVAPTEWGRLVGSYGPAFIPVVVSVKHGHLYATIENEYDYRLTPAGGLAFQIAPGMYSDEQIVFLESPGGRVDGILLAGVEMSRRLPGRR